MNRKLIFDDSQNMGFSACLHGALGLVVMAMLLLSGPVWAADRCSWVDGWWWSNELEADQKNAACAIQTSTNLNPPRFLQAWRMDVEFDGPTPAEVLFQVTIESVQGGGPDGELSRPVPIDQKLMDMLKLDINGEEVQPTGYGWVYHAVFPSTMANGSHHFKFQLNLPARQFPLPRLQLNLNIESNLTRLTGGCWASGMIRGELIFGDKAFWSDNPTGLQGGMENTRVLSSGEAQSALDTIGGMDMEALAKQYPALDLNQLKAAQAASKSVQVGGADTRAGSAALAEEMRQFEGHTFLTIQSIQGVSALARGGGAKANVVDNPSPRVSPEGAEKIFSLSSMSLELDTEFDPQNLEKLLGTSPKILKADLAYKGMDFHFPRDGGEQPLILFGRCPGSEAVCGRMDWPGVANLHFQAGHGAFSCINN